MSVSVGMTRTSDPSWAAHDEDPDNIGRALLIPADASAPPRPAAAHVATTYFAARLRELMAEFRFRDLETGRTRKLTPLTLHKILKEQAPQLACSQTQVYRYVNGEAAPDVAVVYELAILFAVPPTHFIPAEPLAE